MMELRPYDNSLDLLLKKKIQAAAGTVFMAIRGSPLLSSAHSLVIQAFQRAVDL
jgi:hypothetical protein